MWRNFLWLKRIVKKKKRNKTPTQARCGGTVRRKRQADFRVQGQLGLQKQVPRQPGLQSDVLTQNKPKIKPTLISKLIKKYTEGLEKLGDIVEVVVEGTVGSLLALAGFIRVAWDWSCSCSQPLLFKRRASHASYRTLSGKIRCMLNNCLISIPFQKVIKYNIH